MKNKKLSYDVKAQYNSLEELAKAYNIKIEPKQTKNLDKLESQRSKFLGECPLCHQPMRYVDGTNVLVCSNEKCKGYEHERTVKDTVVKSYTPVVKVLDARQTIIAENIFA